MRIVIQCAGRKNQGPPGSGLVGPTDARPVKFVARPDLAPPDARTVYARPDDLFDGQWTWRQMILKYNEEPRSNPARLSAAHRLYDAAAFQDLTRRFGEDKVYILSAGWGLIPAGFLTPDYDITFKAAPNVAPHARRAKSDRGFADFQLMPDDGEDIVFLGGQDYLPMFCQLTGGLKAAKKVFFNTQADLRLGDGFVAERFPTTRRTNWHYECAQRLIEGKLS